MKNILRKRIFLIVVMSFSILIIPSIRVKAESYAHESGNNWDLKYQQVTSISKQKFEKGRYVIKPFENGIWTSTGNISDFQYYYTSSEVGVKTINIASDNFSWGTGFTFICVGNASDRQYYIKTNRGTYLKRTGSYGKKILKETDQIDDATVWQIQDNNGFAKIKDNYKNDSAYLCISSKGFYLSVSSQLLELYTMVFDESMVFAVIRNNERLEALENVSVSEMKNDRFEYANYYRDNGISLEPRSESAYIKILDFGNNYGVTMTKKTLGSGWKLTDVPDESITYKFSAYNTLIDETREYTVSVVLRGYQFDLNRYPDKIIKPSNEQEGCKIWYCTNYDPDAHYYHDTDKCLGVYKEKIPYEWDTDHIQYKWNETGDYCEATCPSKSEPNYLKKELGIITISQQNESTCKDYGSKTVQATFYSDLFTTQTKSFSIPRLQHEWSNPEYTWSQDNSLCTATRKCNLCNEEETETVQATVSTVSPDYNNDGKKTYTANFKNPGFSKQEKEVILPKEIDNINPHVTMNISTDSWNSFRNNLGNALKYNSAQTVRVTAIDNESGIASTQYYLSDQELTSTEAAGVDTTKWKDFSEKFFIPHFNNCVIYVKATDKAGNAVIINSDRVIVDSKSPKITGIEDGKIYYNDVNFTVQDDSLDSVKIDGTPVLSDDNEYGISSDNKQHVIEAKDIVGNTTTYSITVNKMYEITFSIDSEHSITKRAGYGTALIDIPQIPTKAGSDKIAPHWDCKDFSFITSNMTVKPVYTLNTYDINLPSEVGYHTSTTDSTHVSYGDDFHFVVNINKEFRKTSNFQVTLNDDPIQPVSENGQTLHYNINVTKDPIIKVSGLEDGVPPEIQIKLKDNKWQQFIHTVSFQHFYKGVQEADVDITDVSGVTEAFYIISDKPYKSISEIPDIWNKLNKENDLYRIKFNHNSKNYIYVKAVDTSGNIAVVNSDGIVIYSESKLDARNFTFIKGSDKDLQIKTNLNGNTIKDIFIDGRLINKENYTVSDDGYISIKSSYLNSLSNKNYNIEIGVNPGGEEFIKEDNNEIPENMIISLNIIEQSTKSPSTKSPSIYSPKTGTNIANIMFWMALVFVSGGTVLILIVKAKTR